MGFGPGGDFQAHVSRPCRTSFLCGVRERREPATRGHHSAEQGAGLICYSRSRSRLVPPGKGRNGSYANLRSHCTANRTWLVRSARYKGAYLVATRADDSMPALRPAIRPKLPERCQTLAKSKANVKRKYASDNNAA